MKFPDPFTVLFGPDGERVRRLIADVDQGRGASSSEALTQRSRACLALGFGGIAPFMRDIAPGCEVAVFTIARRLWVRNDSGHAWPHQVIPVFDLLGVTFAD